MNVEKLTILDAVEMGYAIDAGRPVLCFSESVRNSRCAAPHAHARAQIIYASKGVMKVSTPDCIWMVPPMQAIWVPGMVEHQVYFFDQVEARNLFLDPSVTATLPTRCFAFDVSSFFKELVLRIVDFNTSQTPTAAEQRVVQVLLDEIDALQPAHLNLPLPNDERLKAITNWLMQHTGKELTLEEAAAKACVSTRTLSRMFMNETGMSYRNWCIRLKLLEALHRLEAGESIARVAFDLGYESTSAFTFMFRRSLGKPPGAFIHERRTGRRSENK